MKKVVFLFGLVLIGGILVVRFVTIKSPEIQREQPPVVCSTDNATTYNFQIINRGFPCEKIVAIGQAYQKEIKPIITKKCLACHGHVDRLPLYTAVPPASWLIHHDQNEAKEYMDMSFDFPFKGTGSITEDFEKIEEIIEEDDMPPFRYIIMHWQSRLTKDEKKVILRWVKESQEKLGE